jgi:hypothetical protein
VDFNLLEIAGVQCALVDQLRQKASRQCTGKKAEMVGDAGIEPATPPV